jgi:predicted amidohydrolase
VRGLDESCVSSVYAELGQSPTNLAKVTDVLRPYNFDLIVLAELCSTGYLFSSRETLHSYAEPVSASEGTQILVDIARTKEACIQNGMGRGRSPVAFVQINIRSRQTGRASW